MADNPTRSVQSMFIIIIALVLAVIYMFWSWYLFDRFAMQTQPVGSNWERALIIYNGIASVGFAAIGVLLGSQVQQTNVARAREEAATKGDALKRANEGVVSLQKQASDFGGSKSTEAAERLEQIRQELMRGL